jgi:predicted RNA binding protein YcfA (HicA-like mRNA interferase family)
MAAPEKIDEINRLLTTGWWQNGRRGSTSTYRHAYQPPLKRSDE